MLRIRLQRVGRKHEPSFRIVLTDSEHATKSGRFKEVLGFYDPRRTGASLKAERISYWLSKGAIATDTVHNLLIKHAVIKGRKIDVSAQSKSPLQDNVSADAPQVSAGSMPSGAESEETAALSHENSVPKDVKIEEAAEIPTSAEAETEGVA